MTAVNEQLRGERDELTIGIILCAGRNRTVVDHTLRDIASPIAVPTYTHRDEPTAAMRAALPGPVEPAAEARSIVAGHAAGGPSGPSGPSGPQER